MIVYCHLLVPIDVDDLQFAPSLKIFIAYSIDVFYRMAGLIRHAGNKQYKMMCFRFRCMGGSIHFIGLVV